VPAGETDRVSVLGIPDARFLPTDTEAMSAMAARLYEREETYYSSIGRPVPPVATLLAISGGGDDGAFGAGLLVGWGEMGTRPPFKMITGISTGALIAPFVFLGDDRTVTQLITEIDQDDVYKKRPLLTGLTSDALSHSIVARIARESRHGRALIVITTNLDAGVPVLWNIGAIAESGSPKALELIRKILLASASMPGVFPPVMFDLAVGGVRHQEMHVDGGASVQTFLYPPGIHAMARSRPVIAYVIRNGRLTPEWEQVERSTLSIANRAVSTLTTNSGLGDIYRMYALAERDGVHFQLAYIADDFTEPHPAADFDNAYMVKLFNYGRAKANGGYRWLSGPPGF
jgi:predicted acylesterase/phospholipase RssA